MENLTLFRYVNHELVEHEITQLCVPIMAEHNKHGILTECRHVACSHMGYLTIREAKAEEDEKIDSEINHLYSLREKLHTWRW